MLRKMLLGLSLLAGLALAGCATPPPSATTSATASPAPPSAAVQALMGMKCYGDSDWNPPLRVVDHFVMENGKPFVMHSASNGEAQFAKVTEWVPGMYGPDKLPLTGDATSLHFTSSDDWNYTETLRQDGGVDVRATKGRGNNTWRAKCYDPAKATESN